MALKHFPPSGGTLSSYLVGSWNSTKDETTFLLINPTSQDLSFRAVFFDMNGNPLLPCVRDKVPANGARRLTVPAFDYSGEGVVKVVSFIDNEEKQVAPGLVGYKILWKWKWIGSWLFFKETITLSETPLFQIPFEVLTDDSNKELNKIMTACP